MKTKTRQRKSGESQGIAITIIVALVAGYITGKILSAFGRKVQVYADSDEFAEAETQASDEDGDVEPQRAQKTQRKNEFK